MNRVTDTEATVAGNDPDRYFTCPVARRVWETRYRYRAAGHDEQDIAGSWRRIADALADGDRQRSRQFFSVLQDFRFLPGGRIQAGAGTDRRVTLFNCFVMGLLEDSIDGIFSGLREGALTMQQGGGVGYDFSTLRPGGTPANSVGAIASGPVSFMRIWDAMCGTLLSTGARRGAMMATLRIDHPDVEDFIDAKSDQRELRHFNLSLLVGDDFMEALRRDEQWSLVFPASRLEGEGSETVMRHWPGESGPVACRVLRRVPARELWRRIMRATYDYAEPGILFIDRINRENNLYYRESISATNPCGEIPLPPYGACNLGSVNLAAYVRQPFSPAARLDLDGVRECVATAVHMLDRVTDLSRFPLEQQAEQARGTRRIGLGITGLADMLVMLGLRYGSDEGLEFAAAVMRMIRDSAYRASVALAREREPFPFLDRDAYLDGPFVERLPADVRDGIARYGIRNSHLTAVAPTGTISLLANNISSGIEPVFSADYTRQLLDADGALQEYTVTDYAVARWRQAADRSTELPPAWVTARELDPASQLAMQAALQPFVDSAISKTVNIPVDYPFENFESLYRQAFELGLKGCTTFRPNPVTGSVLEVDQSLHDSHCCNMEREAD